MLRTLLIILLIPGLLLPVTLQICVCAAEADLCCGEDTVCCCAGNPALDASSASFSADERCAGCVELGMHDGGQRLTAPGSIPLPEMSAVAAEPWTVGALFARTSVTALFQPATGLAPPCTSAPVPLRI